MTPPPWFVCIDLEWDRHCPNAECTNYIAPVAGDLLRRKPLCSRAVADVAAIYGGLSVTDCAWYAGVCRATVDNAQRRGLVKLRAKVER